jgi:hypothetical protein
VATKTRVVLGLNTRLNVADAREGYELSVMQIMKMFNGGTTKVCEILKKKTEIMKRRENCGKNLKRRKRRR